MAEHLVLEGRAVVRVGGDDAEPFLQNLLTNDIAAANASRVVYAALLTPQGKYLFDFFVARPEDAFLFDVAADRAEALQRRLSMYRLRAKVDIEIVSDWRIEVLYGAGACAIADLPEEAGVARTLEGSLLYVDPRRPEGGVRAFVPAGAAGLAPLAAEPGQPASYEDLRLRLGLPESGRDLIVDKSIMLESNLDQLAAVDFTKGCFVGQELTARTRYRGLVRKRLVPVRLEGIPPVDGGPVTRDGRDAGDLRSFADGRGMALLRLPAILEPGGPLLCGEAVLHPEPPSWLELTAEGED